jgi:hypothetical protein
MQAARDVEASVRQPVFSAFARLIGYVELGHAFCVSLPLPVDPLVNLRSDQSHSRRIRATAHAVSRTDVTFR